MPAVRKRAARSPSPDPLIDEDRSIVVYSGTLANSPTLNPIESSSKAPKKRKTEAHSKALQLASQALKLVREAKEAYSGLDYTPAIYALEVLAVGKPPSQPLNDPQEPDNLSELRNDVRELKELISKSHSQAQAQTLEKPSYSNALKKDLAVNQHTQAPQKPSPQRPEPSKAYKQNYRKEHTLVLTKSKDQELPTFDPSQIRDQINASLQTNAIKGVHISPKGNIVLTSLSLSASQLLEKRQVWETVFYNWPLIGAQEPETWPKLIAHFVPIALSPTSFTEEIIRFNNL